MVEAQEIDEGVHCTPLLYLLPITPFHAHPPQHFCRNNAAVPVTKEICQELRIAFVCFTVNMRPVSCDGASATLPSHETLRKGAVC